MEISQITGIFIFGPGDDGTRSREERGKHYFCIFYTLKYTHAHRSTEIDRERIGKLI
jgi:hypothetical protein